MPPRIRTRASRALKENIDVTGNNVKSIKDASKPSRKALADKTNSASDDASLEIPTKSKKNITKTVKVAQKEDNITKQNGIMKDKHNSKPKQSTRQKENVESTNEVRPRRNRQLPKRFVENHVLNNLSSNKDSPDVTHNSSLSIPKANNTPGNNHKAIVDKLDPSPFKSPAKADSSLLTNRPRRICRLPSRFEDHSVSPNKYIPIQPANASTPIQQSKTKSLAPAQAANTSASIEQSKSKHSLPQIDKENVSNKVSKDLEKKQAVKEKPTRLAKIDALQKVSSDNSSDKSSPDSNNNARGRSTRQRTVKTQKDNKKPSPSRKNKSPKGKFLTPINKKQSSIKKVSPEQTKNSKRLIEKNLSFKVLESKKNSQDNEKSNLDVYEFTFDPDEEPQPQKKKRKKPVAKKQPAKPKKVVYKSIYDKNISKALAALKNVVKSGKTAEAPKLGQITENCDKKAEIEQNNVENNVNEVQNTNVITETNTALNDTGKNSVHECNYPSIRVEDIAADIEPSIDHYDDINYSPVNSPRPNVAKSPNAPVNPEKSPERQAHNNDPLNLLEDLSFFDEQPVASSSMNISVRHPLASPWRVEFGSLPIKWPNNTYVKPNMTPAVESSFISSEDTIKKKHVYTNMLPQTNDMFPENVDNTPNLKQTSIISFIKEMAEKSAKKKRRRSVSPTKALYEGIVDTNIESNKNIKSNKKASTGNKATHTSNTSEEVSSSGNDTSHDKENSKEERKTRKRRNDENICDLPAKSPRKQKDKDCTYFGFDESGNQDTENVSPIKDRNKQKGRSLRSRSRTVLQEINGPTRAALPVAAKTKIATSSDAVNQVYEEMKSADDAPMFTEKDVVDNATNIEDPAFNEDSQSVHLFEDIEVVHHVKPTRKSYGKAKKVTFRQRSTSDSDTQEPILADQNESSDYDDLGDLTFEIPNVQEKKTMKKKKPKKLRTKKEEQEAEAWAANFNSMCEDIEEFPLLVE